MKKSPRAAYPLSGGLCMYLIKQLDTACEHSSIVIALYIFLRPSFWTSKRWAYKLRMRRKIESDASGRIKLS